MSYPNETDQPSEVSFRAAEAEDAQAILEFLEEEPSPGKVELIYTRRPDPVVSILREGRISWLLVAQDQGRVVGMAACAMQEVWLGGAPASVGYLFALRVRRGRRRRLSHLPEGYRQLFERFRPMTPRLYYTTILSDNVDAMRLLEKDRPSMPRYEPLTELGTFALFPAWMRRGPRLAPPRSAEVLADFLAEEGSRMDLFPRWSARDLEEGRRCPSLEDFRVWEENGRVVAAAALWDQRAWRQYRVVRYHGILSWLHRFGRLLPGLPRLPDPGADLPLRSLSALAVKERDPERTRVFLRALQGGLPRQTLLVAAAPLGSERAATLGSLTKIRYDSRVYQVRDRQDPGPQERPLGPFYLEVGRL